MFFDQVRHPERYRTGLGRRHGDGRHVHRTRIVIYREEVGALGPRLEFVRLRVQIIIKLGRRRALLGELHVLPLRRPIVAHHGSEIDAVVRHA